MSLEVWSAIPRTFNIHYVPGFSSYPAKQTVTLHMPPEYDPRAEAHTPAVEPTRVPLLQGFRIQYRSGEENVHPAEHWLREMWVKVENGIWHVTHDGAGQRVISQVPEIEITVGLRDNSGGDPPDDGFNADVRVGALVVY